MYYDDILPVLRLSLTSNYRCRTYYQSQEFIQNGNVKCLNHCKVLNCFNTLSSSDYSKGGDRNCPYNYTL